MRETTWAARREWPPRWKKSSSRPTASIARTRHQMTASSSSVSLASGAPSSPSLTSSISRTARSASARRSTLPLGVAGSAARGTMSDGTM